MIAITIFMSTSNLEGTSAPSGALDLKHGPADLAVRRERFHPIQDACQLSDKRISAAIVRRESTFCSSDGQAQPFEIRKTAGFLRKCL